MRVGRFEWERLVLMCVPHPTNFKLLPLGVFMSADGGKARPGNAGLAMFGPHEKTWAKLLRWAVAEGWLAQIERGGARRGPNGTTVVRASVYAAAIPQEVWERRMEILGAPPFRAAGVEGSAETPPAGMKGAPGDSPETTSGLKGAPTTPFNAPDPSMKGAPRDSLPDPLKGAIGVFEGSDPSFEGSVSGFEGSTAVLPHHVVTPSSNSSSTTTTVAEVSSITLAREAKRGGGGGDSTSSEDPTAKAFVAALDYRGKAPKRKQHDGLCARVAAALAAGWTEGELKAYLALGRAVVDFPAGIYAHRLAADELPDVETWRVSQQQALTGTDATVAGWLNMSDTLRREEAEFAPTKRRGGYKPYQNPTDQSAYDLDFWGNPAPQVAGTPKGAEKYPHCGDPACDPLSRLREIEDAQGLRSLTPCTRCHPDMQFG